jgi:hypothetical protein
MIEKTKSGKVSHGIANHAILVAIVQDFML